MLKRLVFFVCLYSNKIIYDNMKNKNGMKKHSKVNETTNVTRTIHSTVGDKLSCDIYMKTDV